MPEINLQKKGFRCSRCNYEWLPRSENQRPLICPKCKSPRWDTEKIEEVKHEEEPHI